MKSITKELFQKKLISPPKFVVENIQYEVIMGSTAYGVANEDSDVDIYGFCIPPKNIIFPYFAGEIMGFGTQAKRFWQFQKHHIKYDKKNYDITIYNIVKYFNLLMQGNPNIIDSLFVPDSCEIFCSNVGKLVRKNKNIFISKKMYRTFKGYAYSALRKIKVKTLTKNNRYDNIQKYGYDIKNAYHLVRLLLEIEEILTEKTLHLNKNATLLKQVRNGEWLFADVLNFFKEKEFKLDKLYTTNDLPDFPDESKIKALLLRCLNYHDVLIPGLN